MNETAAKRRKKERGLGCKRACGRRQAIFLLTPPGLPSSDHRIASRRGFERARRTVRCAVGGRSGLDRRDGRCIRRNSGSRGYCAKCNCSSSIGSDVVLKKLCSHQSLRQVRLLHRAEELPTQAEPRLLASKNAMAFLSLSASNLRLAESANGNAII